MTTVVVIIIYALILYIVGTYWHKVKKKHNQETGESHRHDPPEKSFTATEPGQTMPY